MLDHQAGRDSLACEYLLISCAEWASAGQVQGIEEICRKEEFPAVVVFKKGADAARPEQFYEFGRVDSKAFETRVGKAIPACSF